MVIINLYYNLCPELWFQLLPRGDAGHFVTAGIATGTQVAHVSSQSVITRPHDVQGQGIHSKDFGFGEVTITIAVLGPEEVHVQLQAINVWEIALIVYYTC